MKTSFLFPGQGAQYPGMGKDLHESSRQVRLLFEEASDIGGRSFSSLLFEGSEDDLKATDNTQIAITLVNLSSSLVLQERGIVPDLCAGFSLGEYSALHQAGVLSRRDVLSLVIERGRVMEEASRRLDSPDGSPGMMAVLGLDIDEVRSVIDGTESVYIANHNSTTQVVLSGTDKGLTSVEALLDEAGAMKIVRLRVSGPFHSPLMKEAKDAFAEIVSGVQFSDPLIPLFANVTGRPLESGEQARELCLEQLVSPVQWVTTEQEMMTMAPERILESGPGTVLTALWKTQRNGLKCEPAGTLESIDRLVDDNGKNTA